MKAAGAPSDQDRISGRLPGADAAPPVYGASQEPASHGGHASLTVTVVGRGKRHAPMNGVGGDTDARLSAIGWSRRQRDMTESSGVVV